MKLESLDLNLLLVFEALVAEQNVTRAAERVGLSQPAMSSALSRLRRMLDDPLFERSSGRMQPTRRARQLIRPIGDALARIREALETQPFQPEESAREFRIVATDYVELLVIPQVVAEVARVAPRVTLRVLAAGALFDPPLSLLQSGRADLAIGFYGQVTPQLTALKLFDERWVAVVKKTQKLLRGKLDLRTFLSIPQVRLLYAPTLEGGGMIDMALNARGLERRIGAIVAHVSVVPHIVAATGFLGVIPERLARAEAEHHRLRILEPPIALPASPCVLIRQERGQLDPALLWLSDLIERVVAT
ncbi:MAG TPA: LysR family transcriptional regulator [Thermoanaerobaculia bacterium]|jgi:DNA-binding transcriptional LysR family regulator